MQWVISSGQTAKVLKQSWCGRRVHFPHDTEEAFSRGQISKSTAFSLCESGWVKLGLEKNSIVMENGKHRRSKKRMQKMHIPNKGLVAR